MVGPRSVTCARDADEIVFFSQKKLKRKKLKNEM
jgi:hypothetical protein